MSSAPLDRRVDRLEEAMAELARSQAQAQLELARLSTEMREFKDEMRTSSDKADRHMDEFRRELGGIANKQGRLVEDIIGPSVPATFSALFGTAEAEVTGGIRLRRAHRSDPRSVREFDAIALGGDIFLVVQVKSALAAEAVAAFANSLPEVRDYFPEWTTGRRIIGAVASFSVDPSLVTRAEGLGLYVFGLERNLIDVLNRPGFKPRAF